MATALTRDGREWVPEYLQAIDYDSCIGCGRCFKVCGQSVLAPVEKPIDEEDDEDEECATTVMSIADAGACIGCGACARVCARRAQMHAA